MRLFIAVDLGAVLQRTAADAAAAMRAKLERQAGSSRRAAVSWVAPGNLHLTLRFLGEVDEAGIAALENALTPPVSQAPFEIELGGAGTFPGSGQVRVIWLGVTAGVQELERLFREVEARVTRLGLPAEDRPYRAHLTLGRVRDAGGRDVRAAIAASATGSLGRVRVDHVTLYQSKLSPSGSIYTVRLRTPLQAGA